MLCALPDRAARSLLRAVADMAAVAIEKTRLFKETNQWLAEILTLYTLADQLTKVLDLNHITDSSASILKHALDCSGCCFFLKEKADEAGEALVIKACSGWHESNQDSPQVAYITELAQGLIINPQPIHIEDTQMSQSVDPDPSPAGKPETDQAEIQSRSVMVAPLIVKGEVIGALSIDDKNPNAFSHSEDRLLTIASAQISTAIENIRLYDDLEQRAVELEGALNEVREAHRLRSEFVQDISHELRTPLTFVRAYIELILEGGLGEISNEIEEKLKIVSEKTQTVTRLVEDVTARYKK